LQNHHTGCTHHVGSRYALFFSRSAEAAQILQKLGVAHHLAGNNQKALECVTQALATWHTIGNRSGESLAFESLGWGDENPFPRLSFTRREAEMLAGLTPSRERKMALDFAASRTTATSPDLGQYRIVHFATHGLLNNVHPELSGLVFSLVDPSGNSQDGFLSAPAIFDLSLPAELVVLSGCQTGLGKEVSGEGLVGLTRGFMYAGAARILVSLWKIHDEATAELMTRFYHSLLGKQPLSPAAALRTAQLSMWKDIRWSSPYYWAGFVLQGEPRQTENLADR
jgi:CHAT domain-containing protein